MEKTKHKITFRNKAREAIFIWSDALDYISSASLQGAQTHRPDITLPETN